MNKYEKILGKMGKIAGFTACMMGTVLMLVIVILPLCFEEARSSLGVGGVLLLELAVWVAIHAISYFIGLWFLGERYTPSHVSDGQTVWWPKTTYGYIKRNMVTNLIEIIASALFVIIYVILICCGCGLTLCLVGLILSIMAAGLFYLFYKKQQHQIKDGDFNN